ncbi:MAG: C40 family peptidase [Fimbriimonadaceae bacterium]|nr:C40 family peptidase [Fimbriimonadaceae bacterium]
MPNKELPYETLPIEPQDIPVLTGKMKDCKYLLGAKAPFLGVQLADVKEIDCSGYTRLIVSKACGEVIPDGSAKQLEWLIENHFKESTVEAGKLKDGILRMFVLPQQPGKGVGRHVGFILNGRTYESYGGHGPGSRPWSGKGYQRKCRVFVLSFP